jgi:hypothetical protein
MGANQSMKPTQPLRGKDEGKIMKDEMKTTRVGTCRGLPQLLWQNSLVQPPFSR